MDFSFGSDPEFMLTKGGRYYSAIPIIKASHEKTKRLTRNGHQFYYDNVLAECAIKPGTNKGQVIDNFRECFRLYAEMVRPYRLTIQASQDYSDDQLQHKDAREAACMQEWDAYTIKPIVPPDDIIKKTPFRSAGGHVHLGAKPLTNAVMRPLYVYMLDLFLGVPSLFLDQDPTSKRRRTIYGKAGSHRDPKYGLEYRTLGNFWLASPELTGLVWEICQFVLNFMGKDEWQKFWTLNEEMFAEEDTSLAYRCFGYDSADLQEAINACDKKAGAKFLDFIGNYLPDSINAEIHHHIEASPPDFYESWGL
jgi:hypothetical protein